VSCVLGTHASLTPRRFTKLMR